MFWVVVYLKLAYDFFGFSGRNKRNVGYLCSSEGNLCAHTGRGDNSVWYACSGNLLCETQGMIDLNEIKEKLHLSVVGNYLAVLSFYAVFLQFEDDDKRCYLELNYQFEIKCK